MNAGEDECYLCSTGVLRREHDRYHSVVSDWGSFVERCCPVSRKTFEKYMKILRQLGPAEYSLKRQNYESF